MPHTVLIRIDLEAGDLVLDPEVLLVFQMHLSVRVLGHNLLARVTVPC